MIKTKKIKVGKKHIEALTLPLQSEKLVVLRGSRGYVMCGYLNLKVAEKFKDVAIKIVGVSSIEEALGATVHSCSYPAKRLGIRKGDCVKDILKIIA